MLNQAVKLGSRSFTRSQRVCFSTIGLEVVHNVKSKEFTVNLDTYKAFLKYNKLKDGVLAFEHTEVPEVFQGKGVGRLIVTVRNEKVTVYLFLNSNLFLGGS